MLCNHCKLKRICRPGGLCYTCYANRNMRKHYLPIRLPEDSYSTGFRLPSKPTSALPGTEEKIRVLEERAKQQVCLWHPEDGYIGYSISEERYMPDNRMPQENNGDNGSTLKEEQGQPQSPSSSSTLPSNNSHTEQVSKDSTIPQNHWRHPATKHTYPSQHEAEEAVKTLLLYIGENPERDGLRDTPKRVVKALREMTRGYYEQGPAVILSTVFDQYCDEIIVVRNIPFVSLCLLSKQFLYTSKGYKRASAIEVGDKLWTLDNGTTKTTKVVSVSSRKVREILEVTTSQGVFYCTPEHPFATESGWVEACDLGGKKVEWTEPRKLCRERLSTTKGYWFGYALGAIFSDGCTRKNQVRLVVGDAAFARKFAYSLNQAFGIEAKVGIANTSGGVRIKNMLVYRVCVVSSFLADLIRHYAGGDAHHMRQNFPRVVLNDRETFRGFLDGYIDGDGTEKYYWKDGEKVFYGKQIVSGNKEFLLELADIVGAQLNRSGKPNRFVPGSKGSYSIYLSNDWERRHGFQAEEYDTTLKESEFVSIRNVKALKATGIKPYTVYSFQCSPYPTFLVGGHLSHNCEHHMLTYTGTVDIGYLPGPHDGRHRTPPVGTITGKHKVVGLSKLARLVDHYARRLSIQERLTQQIAEAIMDTLHALGAGVIVRASHSCMSCRGVSKTGTEMVTSTMLGVFRTKPEAKAELLSLFRS